jgi:hypothetical protein
LQYWKDRFTGRCKLPNKHHKQQTGDPFSVSTLSRNGYSVREYENTIPGGIIQAAPVPAVEAEGAPPNSDDYYSVIHNSEDSFSSSGQSATYTNVNESANSGIINPSSSSTTLPSKTLPYELAELPPSNLAPGFEYNHLDFGKRPATKTGTKQPAAEAAGNYHHVTPSPKSPTSPFAATAVDDGGYALAANPNVKNSSASNDPTYQEPLKPGGGVYHVLDSEAGTRESTTSTDSYHVAGDIEEEDDISGGEHGFNSVYHVPNDDSDLQRKSTNTSSVYYDPDNPSGGGGSSSGGDRVYLVLEEDPVPRESAGDYHVPGGDSSSAKPDSHSAKPQIGRKPVGVYEVAKIPDVTITPKNPRRTPGAKKPPAPAKPGVSKQIPAGAKQVFPKGGKSAGVVSASANYDLAKPPAIGVSAKAAGANYDVAMPPAAGVSAKPAGANYDVARPAAGVGVKAAGANYDMAKPPAAGVSAKAAGANYKAAGANYDMAKPITSSAVNSPPKVPSNSTYQLAGAVTGQKSSASVSKPTSESDYHSLDFDGNRMSNKSAVLNGDDRGVVYSHLNDEGEDAYNEVSRNRKHGVIDSEYSHLHNQ